MKSECVDSDLQVGKVQMSVRSECANEEECVDRTATNDTSILAMDANSCLRDDCVNFQGEKIPDCVFSEINSNFF